MNVYHLPPSVYSISNTDEGAVLEVEMYRQNRGGFQIICMGCDHDAFVGLSLSAFIVL